MIGVGILKLSEPGKDKGTVHPVRVQITWVKIGEEYRHQGIQEKVVVSLDEELLKSIKLNMSLDVIRP